MATCFWLNNKCSSLLRIELCSKIFRILRQNPCRREELKFSRARFLKSLQTASQKILSCNNIDSWEVVYSLIGLHLQKKRWYYRAIHPVNVPFRIFNFIKWIMHVQCFRYISQYLVLCILQIYSQLGHKRIAWIRMPLICNQLGQGTNFELVNEAISSTVWYLGVRINYNDIFSYLINWCLIKPLVCLTIKVWVCNQLCVCPLFLETFTHF